MNRRSFLKRGIFGGVLLAVAGGTGLALRATKTRAFTSKILSATEAAVLAAVAEVVVPKADGKVIVERIDTSISYLAPESQSDFKLLLGLVESALAGFLFDARTAPFTTLTAEDRIAVLGRWRDSRLAIRRSGYQALRKSCLAAFYGDPATWAEAGYAGPHRIAGLSYEDSKIGMKR